MKIGDKYFFNLQEAVAWLLDNNALPFQSTANYVPDTEIAKTTIVNPSPAEIRVGALVFFADSKVATVKGVSSNGFIVGSDYINLMEGLGYITNVAINASGHLISVLSDGRNIDAGIVKQVSYFAIDGSQHLIVNYNDGTSTDLGAIFSGNVNIAGNFTADSIIENMAGYGFEYDGVDANVTINTTYASAVKTGNKITFVWAFEVTRTGSVGSSISRLGDFVIPASVGAKLYPYTLGWSSDILYSFNLDLFSDLTTSTTLKAHVIKDSNTNIGLFGTNFNSALTENVTYTGRAEVTFLLNDSLAS